MSEQESEQDGFYQVALPCWKFSRADMVGIALTTVGGVFSAVSQGFHLAAREFAARANWERQTHDLQQAQAEYDAQREAAAEELRLLVDGPDDYEGGE